ncbi:type II methionyl aminopeptidase [Candidatus Bathyarchaeota archaeon]|nr:type II methionyl aminopeptidase [Candidatus Bathyarchaeota archaeon]
MLSDDVKEAYLKAGKIASETRSYARGLVKEGASILELCTAVEETIMSKGGRPAFPCNIDVNEVAAHYSSPIGDKKIIPRGALVKVDLGVHVDGYIADTAVTVSLDPTLEAMVRGADEALKEAILAIRPRAKNGDIGGNIESVIERYGFQPIRNLSGHQMTRFVLHTGKSIPNVRSLGVERIIEDEVYAVEPFLTVRSAKGQIRADDYGIYIYRFHHKEKRLRSAEAKKLLEVIWMEFKSLPFSQRWLKDVLPPEELNVAFKELVKEKCVVGYPILIEETGQTVAQAEHTLIVTKDGCMVTTL